MLDAGGHLGRNSPGIGTRLAHCAPGPLLRVKRGWGGVHIHTRDATSKRTQNNSETRVLGPTQRDLPGCRPRAPGRATARPWEALPPPSWGWCCSPTDSELVPVSFSAQTFGQTSF